jgi:hypothetical protein
MRALRRHLSRKVWRGVHLLVYVSWPIAWLHSYTASPDMRHGVLFILALLCALAVGAGVIWRIAAAARDIPRAERVGLLMTAMHGLHGRSGTQERTERTPVR